MFDIKSMIYMKTRDILYKYIISSERRPISCEDNFFSSAS